MNQLSKKTNRFRVSAWTFTVLLCCLLILTVSCERPEAEIALPASPTDELQPTEQEIDAAINLVSLTGKLTYRLGSVDLTVLDQFLSEDQERIDHEEFTRFIKQTKYQNSEQLIEDLREYYVWKLGIQLHLERSGRTQLANTLFAKAQHKYAEALGSELKSNQECAAEQANCIAQAITDATAASFSCNGSYGDELRNCFTGDTDCNNNSFIILQFDECEARIFTDYANAITSCQQEFEDCCEEEDEPVIIFNFGNPSWTITSGGGGCSNCSGPNYNFELLAECLATGEPC
ncbi:MAG: hypothetical protein AAFN81_02865 [Bacteroidota bacterium]